MPGLRLAQETWYLIRNAIKTPRNRRRLPCSAASFRSLPGLISGKRSRPLGFWAAAAHGVTMVVSRRAGRPLGFWVAAAHGVTMAVSRNAGQGPYGAAGGAVCSASAAWFPRCRCCSSILCCSMIAWESGCKRKSRLCWQRLVVE